MVAVMDHNPATLRRLREDRGLTRAQLADKAGVTLSTLNKLETGQRKPGVETVAALAAALDVDPYVFRFTPDEATMFVAALARNGPPPAQTP